MLLVLDQCCRAATHIHTPTHPLTPKIPPRKNENRVEKKAVVVCTLDILPRDKRYAVVYLKKLSLDNILWDELLEK